MYRPPTMSADLPAAADSGPVDIPYLRAGRQLHPPVVFPACGLTCAPRDQRPGRCPGMAIFARFLWSLERTGIWDSMRGGGGGSTGMSSDTWPAVHSPQLTVTVSYRTVKHVSWIKRMLWRKVIKEARWSGWVWVGECFFWYRPTRVVPDQRPLNGRCCCMCEFRSNDRFRTNAPNTCKHSIRNDYVIVLIEAPKPCSEHDNLQIVVLAAHCITIRPLANERFIGLMGLLQLRFEHDSATTCYEMRTIQARFEHDTTSYEELCAFEQ